MTEKRSGLGLTFGPLGAIKCPSCGYKAGWGAFKKEKDLPSSSMDGSSNAKSVTASPEEEKEKSLDDTKYESP